MIPQLIQTAVSHNVPVSFITGRFEAGATAARRDQGWHLMEARSPWRPAGKSEFAVGRLIPVAALPSFDQEEVISGTGKVLFTQQQQHRITLRVPQRAPFDESFYQEARAAVEGALELIARLEAEGRIVRVLATPNSYTTSGGGLSNNIAMTTQHLPLAIEDQSTGQLLWVHPEAEYIVAGGRLGGGQADAAILPTSAAPSSRPRRTKNAAQASGLEAESPALAPASAGPSAPPAPPPVAPAAPSEAKPETWYPSLLEQVVALMIPEENRRAALVKLRARDLQAQHPSMNGDLALVQAEKDITAAMPAEADYSWLGQLLAEAQELGVPQKAQADYAVGVRSRLIQARQGITALEADAMASQEVQAGIQALKHPKAGPKAAPKPGHAQPAGDSEEPPRELLELKAFVDRKEISIVKIAELINMSQSVTSRYFSGSRGARGFDPMILGQFSMITAALKAKQPLPAPLAKTAKKAAGAPARMSPSTPTEKV